MYIQNYDSLANFIKKKEIMVKNNLKIVKSNKNREDEVKEKNKKLGDKNNFYDSLELALYNYLKDRKSVV